MSKRLKKYSSYLRTLHEASPKLRQSMLKHNKDDGFVCCISEICFNVLKGMIELSARQKQQLSRKKHALRFLTLRRVSKKRKRKLIQSGGFIGALLGPIVAILGQLFGSE